MDTELIFCGDTMLGAGVLRSKPFENVASLLRQADISFCNLETSLSEEGTASPKRHVIATPSESVELIRETGFHLVNVANNHILDRGEACCERMIRLLKSKGIEVLGLQQSGQSKPIIISRNGIKFGFLGYADYGFHSGLMPLRERAVLRDIKALRAQVDCVVISLHWGHEYVELPAPAQQRLARKLIDAGAHLIVGHHPHVAQGIEEYRAGLIAYSLGNFQFRVEMGDDFLSNGTGIILKVQRSAEGRFRYTALPIKLSAAGTVELSSESDPSFNVGHLKVLSVALNGKRVSRLHWTREASRLWFPSQLEAWFFKIERFGSLQRLRMLQWLLRPTNLCYLLFYLLSAKHQSSRALFARRHS